MWVYAADGATHLPRPPPADTTAVGSRLLISREDPAYIAANIRIWMPLHDPSPVDAGGSSYSSAFDQWCLLHIPFTVHVTNQKVRSRTGQPLVTSLVKSRRLKLFSHIARAEPASDHACALRVSISRLPEDWRRPIKRSSTPVLATNSRS